MLSKNEKKNKRLRRKIKIRKKIKGTPERPRLTVFRSLKYIYAQIIDDESGVTLVSASTLEKDIREKLKSTKDVEAAKAVGELVAKRALEKGIETVVFDRNGYRYHGRVKALADAAREAGLKF